MPTIVLVEFVHEYCKVLDPLILVPVKEPVDCPQLLGITVGIITIVGARFTNMVATAELVQLLMVPVTVYVVLVAGFTFIEGPVPPVFHE